MDTPKELWGKDEDGWKQTGSFASLYLFLTHCMFDGIDFRELWVAIKSLLCINVPAFSSN